MPPPGLQLVPVSAVQPDGLSVGLQPGSPLPPLKRIPLNNRVAPTPPPPPRG